MVQMQVKNCFDDACCEIAGLLSQSNLKQTRRRQMHVKTKFIQKELKKFTQ